MAQMDAKQLRDLAAASSRRSRRRTTSSKHKQLKIDQLNPRDGGPKALAVWSAQRELNPRNASLLEETIDADLEGPIERELRSASTERPTARRGPVARRFQRTCATPMCLTNRIVRCAPVAAARRHWGGDQRASRLPTRIFRGERHYEAVGLPTLRDAHPSAHPRRSSTRYPECRALGYVAVSKFADHTPGTASQVFGAL